MIWVRILVRRKLQTLSYPTHKDSNQYLSRLLNNIRLKIHDFGNFQEMSPKSEKTQNPNSSARSNQDIFVVRQKCVFNPSALEGSDLVISTHKNSDPYHAHSPISCANKDGINCCSKSQFPKIRACSRQDKSVTDIIWDWSLGAFEY